MPLSDNMADKPQEPIQAANYQDVRKYLCLFTIAIIASNSLFIGCIVFVMQSKEMTVKFSDSENEAKMTSIQKHHVDNAETRDGDRIDIGDLWKKISELEGKYYKELKMKIEKVEDRVNENLFYQNTCDENESTFNNCDENFKTMVIEVKKEIKEELTTKLSELEKQINGLGQKVTTDSESLRNFFTKKVAEMEGRFATRAETEARLSELEKRLNSDQARVNDEKASTSKETGSVESTRYVKPFPKLILCTAGILVFAITVSVLCFFCG